jgi:predicted transcriptional regulator
LRSNDETSEQALKDRRPIERLVNKGFVERHTLNSQQEEYVLTAIGKKVLDNK